jgi:hypothetical protein|tara:strand:- start:347 stop:658 length:312 start_codon:yes stop_codon:yes gene_type:complete
MYSARLREAIEMMKATSSDIDTILYRIMDAEDYADLDIVCNMLTGLKELHDSRVMRLQDEFKSYPEFVDPTINHIPSQPSPPIDAYDAEEMRRFGESIFNPPA